MLHRIYRLFSSIVSLVLVDDLCSGPNAVLLPVYQSYCIEELNKFTAKIQKKSKNINKAKRIGLTLIQIKDET